MASSVESNIQGNEQKYKTIFNSDVIGIMITDLNDRITDANPFFLKMLGYTRKDLETGSLTRLGLTAPEDVEKTRKIIQRLIEKKRVGPYEKQFLHKNGNRIDVLVSATVHQDGSIIAIIINISEFKENVEAKTRQMKFLSDISLTLAESFDLGQILKNFTQRSASFLADICSISLLDNEGLEIGKTEISSRSEKDRSIVDLWKQRRIFADMSNGPGQVMRTGQSRVLKNKYIDPITASEVAFVPIQLPHQESIGFATFLVKSEANSNYSPFDLSLAEEICRRLAVAIENSRLYFKAQESSQAKSDFLANISHEIRTPLGAILGFAELLLEDGSVEKDRKKTAEIILRNGQHLLGIVNEVLDISKIESDKVQIEILRFQLQNL
ncbi:MAG: histidine kinase dimerization/phospho-acceptor domain-containing protein, partial [Pseudobdellovibrionaceae bacterium]